MVVKEDECARDKTRKPKGRSNHRTERACNRDTSLGITRQRAHQTNEKGECHGLFGVIVENTGCD